MHKRQMNHLLLFIALLTVVFVLSACSGTPATQAPPAPTAAAAQPAAPTSAPAASSKKVLLVTGTGGLGDQGFNDLGNSGAQRAAKDSGVTVDVHQTKEVAELEQVYRTAASGGQYALIIGLGFEQGDPANLVAKDFPKQNFAIVDSSSSQPNVEGVLFREEENGFLAGVVAANLTQQTDLAGINKDKVIGIVLGADVPSVRRYAFAYEAGARTVDSQVKVLVGVVGDFSDQAKAKELALAQIDQGADVVYQVAGGAGLGVFGAAEAKGVYAIGEGSNQNLLHPTYIVASSFKRMDNAVYGAIEDALAGKFKGGAYNYGFAENDLVVTMDGSQVKLSDKATAALKDYQAKLAARSIKPPTTQDEFNAYLTSIGIK
ncbi:MAG: BMP family ABC transporter substrate-binding protein [Chloroflexi bacterium]|nr:BMP family ABC transporter substrate-binding protein [Chloroflexota bacterium]